VSSPPPIPNGRIIERNLADGSIPYLSEPWIEAAYTPESARTHAQRKMLALSEWLIDEVFGRCHRARHTNA
jgi:FMN-dependent NADH-azoreductase